MRKTNLTAHVLIQQIWNTAMYHESFCCRVCGLDQGEKPWGDDGMTPSFDICSCCGVQFGYEDSWHEGIQKYRKAWFERKSKWFRQKEMPLDWSLEVQMKNIPKAFCP